MTNWEPQPQGLSEIVNTLQASATPNNEIQQQSYQRIQQFNQNPEFNKYLVHILSKIPSDQVGNDTRQRAGLLLKQNIRNQYHQFPQDVKLHVQQNVVPVLADPNPNIRNAVSSVITTAVAQSNLEEWPELITMILQLLESSDNNAIAGAMSTCCKICEDSADKLADSPSRPLNILIPKLMQYFQHQNPLFRRDALMCINYLMIVMPAALTVNMDVFLQGLSNLTQDSSTDVRKLVCQSIVILLEVGVQFLVPHMDSIIQFILSATADPDESVALEACEFWSSFCDQPCFSEIKGVLEKVLPQIIPLLLQRMVYCQDDIAIFEAEEQDQNENVPDRPEDIKPIFHKSKGEHGHGGHEGDEDDESDPDDDDGDDVLGEWNLRKCAAAGLDILSHNYGNSILPVLLPLLQDRLGSQGHWSIRESGILALGAIAEGCMSGITPHLPQLFPYLMQLMDDPAPLIRSITCWTLSRYAGWAVSQNDHEKILKPLMEGMLKRVLDHNKKVQEAACSAFCTLEEEAQHELVPYLGPILQNLMFAFHKYQAKNLLILYDAIGTLADSVGEAINAPELISVLMPPLIAKWNALPDDSRELFPLLECLTSVAQALGLGFQEFANPVLQRCLRLIEAGLLSAALYQQNPEENDPPDPEFIVCSLDLISGIAEGIGGSIQTLISGTNLLQMLFECTKDPVADVRQSALALVGDLTKSCIDVLKPGLAELIPVLIKNIDPGYHSVCNNATWALGEIAVKIGPAMEPFVIDCMRCLIPMINQPKLPKNLQENGAITIGRLGYVCPSAVAPMLPEFLQRWCVALRLVRDPLDREHCFLGLCYLVKANPAGTVQSFMFVCGAISSYDWETHTPTPELHDMFSQILHGFKQSLSDNWQQYFQSFPATLRQFLIRRYDL